MNIRELEAAVSAIEDSYILEAGETIATVYARDEASAREASTAIRRCIVLGTEKVPPCKLIHAIVTNDEVERL